MNFKITRTRDKVIVAFCIVYAIFTFMIIASQLGLVSESIVASNPLYKVLLSLPYKVIFPLTALFAGL